MIKRKFILNRKYTENLIHEMVKNWPEDLLKIICTYAPNELEHHFYAYFSQQ
jgi:hypothetical protein